MIKLQNNFTTPEQSNRLLELGVPIYSADMYYEQCYESPACEDEVRDFSQEKILYIHEPNLRHINPKGTWIWEDGKKIDLSGKVDELRKTYIPCWSVGRLIEIIGICAGIKYIQFETLEFTQAEWLEKLIKIINDFVKCNKIDFSKLEE